MVDSAERSVSGIPVANEGRHIGKIVGEDGRHLVQDVGRGRVVAHDVNKFDRPPSKGDIADILYRDGLVKMVEPLTHDNHSVGISIDTR